MRASFVFVAAAIASVSAVPIIPLDSVTTAVTSTTATSPPVTHRPQGVKVVDPQLPTDSTAELPSKFFGLASGTIPTIPEGLTKAVSALLTAIQGLKPVPAAPPVTPPSTRALPVTTTTSTSSTSSPSSATASTGDAATGDLKSMVPVDLKSLLSSQPLHPDELNGVTQQIVQQTTSHEVPQLLNKDITNLVKKPAKRDFGVTGLVPLSMTDRLLGGSGLPLPLKVGDLLKGNEVVTGKVSANPQ